MKNLKLLLLVSIFSVFNFKTNEENAEISNNQKVQFLNNLINDTKKEDGEKIIFKNISLNSFGDWNEIYKKENFLQSENCEIQIDNNKRFEQDILFLNPIIKSIKIGTFEFKDKKNLYNSLFNIDLESFKKIFNNKTFKDITEELLNNKIKTNLFIDKDNKYIELTSIFNFCEENNNFNMELLFIFNKENKLNYITTLNDNSAFYTLIEKNTIGFVLEVTEKLPLKLFEKEEKNGKIIFKNIIKQNKDGQREDIEFIDIKNIKIK